jgi:hypothetical protein
MLRNLLFIILFVHSDRVFAQTAANTYINNPLVERNTFLTELPDYQATPSFNNIKGRLPTPVWSNRSDIIDCYWKAWEIAFSNVHSPTKENNFISPYIDPAFNGHIFMWDTSFMVLFGRYGARVFNFQGSLDNFYHRQHPDGFICREISSVNGDEIFNRFDPSSTGPNIIPWAEWEYFLNFKDYIRLNKVFYPLLAYYEWFKANRSWPDGSYFSTGWGCGMDNQPRLPQGYHNEFSPGFMSWIDISLQQVMSGKILVAMSKELNKQSETVHIRDEVKALSQYIQQKMWSGDTFFFYDRFRNGSLSTVKSVASYWALLAEVVPNNMQEKFISHLANTKEFSRLHRVPTLSADDPHFSSTGNYWQGGVWAPTTYMILRGLTKYKKDSLAFAIGYNHLDNVVKVFTKTQTLWENYAPDEQRGMFKRDMVGWTGLVPISILFEYVFGIRPDVSNNTITWDIHLTDEFGLKKYPYKNNGLINFWCAKRNTLSDEPKVKVTSTVSFNLRLIWEGGIKMIHINSIGQKYSP